ncbi:MAG: T9SS type A sorting domain-containing protein [Ignavibacteria bacterium]
MKNYFYKILLIILIFSTSIYSQKSGSDDILPIELLYFEGFAISNGILLRWGTATEINNFGFEVQRADTSKIFEYVDFVPGSGNSNSPKHYLMVDTTLPAYGLYFYRLKQIDTDGSYHFSDTIQIYFNPLRVEDEKLNSRQIVVFRNNYLTKEIEINFEDEFFTSPIDIEIFTILGQKIFKQSYNLSSNKLKISYSNFSSGLYIISIKTAQRTLSTAKLIITR